MVSGRHRDKALAAARKVKAIELRLRGLSYQEIANELGYANRGSVYTIIQHALALQVSAVVEEHRELELARLDALMLALWPAAQAGDVGSIDAAVRIVMERSRLLGLLLPRAKRKPTCGQPQTVVLMKNDCRVRRCPEHA
jgi:hypothetical protein